MKIDVTVRKVKNIRGRVRNYVAEFGRIACSGATPAEAQTFLASAILRACNTAEPVIVAYRGHVAVITEDCTGSIDTRYVHPDGSKSLTCGSGGIKAAEHSARLNLAQMLWDGGPDAPCVLNTPELIREFTSWRDWQEAYKAHRAAGKSDDEARRAISGF